MEIRLQLPFVLKLIHLGTCTAKVCWSPRLWIMNLMIVFLSWGKRFLTSDDFTVTQSFITIWCRMGQLHLRRMFCLLSTHLWSSDLFLGISLRQTTLLCPNHTFNAGTNWLCYCSWMWALLCISPYIRRCWDLGACVTKTCLAVLAAGIEQTSECIKRFVSYYRVRQPVHKNSSGDCKHLLPDFSWGMWTTLLEYLQFEFSVLQP